MLNIINSMAAFFTYFLLVVPFELMEFRLGRPSYKSNSTLRQPNNLMMAYRTAQILQGRVLSLSAVFMLPTQAIVYKLVVFTSYMLFKHGNEMDKMSIAVLISWGGAAMTFWCIVLLMGGNTGVHLREYNFVILEVS